MKKIFLRNITRFGVGGRANIFEVKKDERVPSLVRRLHARGEKMFVLGGGTNIIANDAGYTGPILAIRTKNIRIKKNSIRADAGVLLETLVRTANRKGLAGLETLAGIPGTVGGALYGNAGAYGREIREVVQSVSVFDGKKMRTLSRRACAFGYRESIFKKRSWVIVSAVFFCKKENAENLIRTSKQIRAMRIKKYPRTLRCAGSIFKNILVESSTGKKILPNISHTKIIKGKIPAGVLLEGVGAKGMKKGNIRVAGHHANLIVNTGGGKAKDVLYIIDTLKKRVRKKYGITLEEEVQYLGF
ncbi:MAG: UDP-N-acetylmuramate dehydrogenase [bacterium]|nr:UDP-N-acetylmuramate dehydrogenase [bacterium]